MRQRRLRDGRMVTVHENAGLRKICQCPRRRRASCPHAWYFSFTLRGQTYRFSLDRHLGRKLTSRTEAEAEAEKIRVAIRAGTFRSGDEFSEPTAHTVQQPPGTLESVCSEFLTRHARSAVPGRRRTGPNGTKASWGDDAAMLRVLCRFELRGQRLGDLPVTVVCEDHVDGFLQHLAAVGRAASTRNHYLRLIKLLDRWTVRKGYRPTPLLTPSCELRQDREVPRNRRLAPGEEERLLRAAQPGLRALLIAALETCARRGELLTLQWREVDLFRRRLRLLARKTKDGEERVIPVSTRLAGILEIAKVGPDGADRNPEEFVFGDVTGAQVRSVKTAWRATCRRAGIDDLRFHDLRHEAGSRLVEAGWPLHYVQAMLGHSNLKQTSTYLNVPLGGLEEAMRKYDQQRTACKLVAIPSGPDPRPDCNNPPAPAGNPHIH